MAGHAVVRGKGAVSPPGSRPRSFTTAPFVAQHEAPPHPQRKADTVRNQANQRQPNNRISCRAPREKRCGALPDNRSGYKLGTTPTALPARIDRVEALSGRNGGGASAEPLARASTPCRKYSNVGVRTRAKEKGHNGQDAMCATKRTMKRVGAVRPSSSSKKGPTPFRVQHGCARKIVGTTNAT